MKIKTFKQHEKEKIEKAKFIIKKANEIEAIVPEILELKETLADPYNSTKEEVLEIANAAAEIYDVGLPTNTPVVEKWTKKKLGINGNAFSEILENSNNKEEVVKNILTEMETPKEIITEALKQGQSKTK